MHAKSTEVTQFLEHNLLPQVKAILAQHDSAGRSVIQEQLHQARKAATALGVNPDASPKVAQLRAALAEAVNVGTVESEIYDHLYGFFRRYYSEGDFLSKRVYKPGVYAIPYEGEDVKLHWANADQYYIKTTEYLRDYAFRLRPNNATDPMRVRFHLEDATEGQHGNVTPADAKKRVFVLRHTDFIAEVQGEDGRRELVARFEYRPASIADWPTEERQGKQRPPTQKDLIRLAARRLLNVDDRRLIHWLKELATPYVTATGEATDKSRLQVHLNRYTARNTFDCFIHKDLGGFLRRELDFYIKNEVMHLDDVENETAPRVEQYLSKIKAVRRIGHAIIDFLAQLEDFQKTLWMKKKFVVETSYCIRMACIPETFWPHILANDAQRDEWTTLLATKNLKDNIHRLIVDTRHFDRSFVDRCLAAIDHDLDDLVDGLLVHSENWQALRLLQQKYAGQIKHVYIDPPYNTDAASILYKNDYKHSSWLSLLDNRLQLSSMMMREDAILTVAIDENELERLGLLLGALFPSHARTCVTIIHNPGGIQGNNFSYNNDFAYFVYPAKGKSIGFWNREDNPDIRPLRDVSTGQHLRTDARNCFYPILVKDNEIVGFGDVCDDSFHPQSANIDAGDGICEVYPIDPKGNERKWVFGRQRVESIIRELSPRYIRSRGIVDIYRRKTMFNYKTVWTDNRYNANTHGSKLLRHVIGAMAHQFTFPKSLYTVMDCVEAATQTIDDSSIILDYFAGSGTTGHAVINLNREDDGKRKFILVEMSDYFDTVLLPRIKKVMFAPEWKNGTVSQKPTSRDVERSPRIVKIIRLESYEDTLNNLVEPRRTANQQAALAVGKSDSTELGAQYVLRYMLDIETRASPSLLNVAAFTDPTSYWLTVKTPGSDESADANVDLLETFNWLIGLTVHHIAAPNTFEAEAERDGENRLRLIGKLEQREAGRWWFRSVTGKMPDGRSVLVIWRKRPGGEDPEGIEMDNLVLDEWVRSEGYLTKENDYELIYVNGSNNLENLKAPSDTWTVRLIEEDFHRLMFEPERQ